MASWLLAGKGADLNESKGDQPSGQETTQQLRVENCMITSTYLQFHLQVQ